MSDHFEDLVIAALKQAGAKLERQHKHTVWRFPDNTMWICPNTASDVRAWKNQWSNLRKRLGLNAPDRGLEGKRRERVAKSAPTPAKPVTLNSVPPPLPLHSQLNRIRLEKPKRAKPQSIPREEVSIEKLQAKWSHKPHSSIKTPLP